MAQVGDGPSAGVTDRGQGLVQPFGRGGQIPCRLGLHHHRRHMVGHHVVQLAGDPGAFGDAGVLGDPPPVFGLRVPVGTQPCPGAPGEDQHRIERHEPGDRLAARPQPVQRDRPRHIGRGEHERGGPPVPFQMGPGADQREGQRGARDRVVAAQLVDGEAGRHQGQTDRRPATVGARPAAGTPDRAPAVPERRTDGSADSRPPSPCRAVPAGTTRPGAAARTADPGPGHRAGATTRTAAED
ncbi:hypothetical protein EDD90_6702 [Streptomyces sp. Ag109_O5-1]|nr:hypothetical protein EDD90_6702 [Streptomyces sp. Ag109_O5-1]